MTSRNLARAMLRRLRAPATWGAAAAFAAVWVVMRLLSGVPLASLGTWECFVPALFVLGQVTLAPLPWQWSGQARSGPGLWRGGLQALAWDTLWVVLLLWGLRDLVKPPHPEPARIAQAGQQEPSPPEARGPRAQPPPPPPADEGRDQPPPPPRADDTVPPPPGPARPGEARQPPPGLPQELNLLMLNLPFALILGWFLAGKEGAEAREQELLEKEHQAQALALQAQLHPHALYNVLAGLAELVHEDPDATEQGLISLVDLLRMLTRHGASPSQPLAQERALLRRYLAIESLRLGDRLRVQWDWPPWADTLELPPLLLQPLVENAVKHGIAPSPEGGDLRIEVFRQGEELLLRVANTGGPWKPQAPEGTGLANLRARLALLPRLKGSLTLREAGGWTLAELRLRATMAP